MLETLPVTDTRYLFRPISAELLTLLRGLAPDNWLAPTVAGDWRVRDVVAHLVDTALRRVSFHRDGHTPPSPPRPIERDADLTAMINAMNREWVSAAARFSPRVLASLYESSSGALADFVEALPLEAPARFPVSWAGEQTSASWFDIGREFTEVWHHQRQVRDALGAPALADPRYLRATLEIAVRGLPHAFRAVTAETGATLVLNVEGASGGVWTLRRDVERWSLWCGEPPVATTRVRIADMDLERLLFNALTAGDAAAAMRIEGRRALALALVAARSVIV